MKGMENDNDHSLGLNKTSDPIAFQNFSHKSLLGDVNSVNTELIFK